MSSPHIYFLLTDAAVFYFAEPAYYTNRTARDDYDLELRPHLRRIGNILLIINRGRPGLGAGNPTAGACNVCASAALTAAYWYLFTIYHHWRSARDTQDSCSLILVTLTWIDRDPIMIILLVPCTWLHGIGQATGARMRKYFCVRNNRLYKALSLCVHIRLLITKLLQRLLLCSAIIRPNQFWFEARVRATQLRSAWRRPATQCLCPARLRSCCSYFSRLAIFYDRESDSSGSTCIQHLFLCCACSRCSFRVCSHRMKL